MQLSEKNKYYLIKIYNAVKIVGNICAIAFLCFWTGVVIYAVPKGEIGLRDILECRRVLHHFCLNWYQFEQIIFSVISIYIGWKMIKKMFKIQSLKKHIMFWLTPLVLAFIQIWVMWHLIKFG